MLPATLRPQVSNDVTNPSLTFIPLQNDAGSGFVYLELTINGSYLGSYPMTPNQPYTINAVEGDEVSFSYKYTVAGGAQVFSDAESFTVGSISASDTYGVDDIKVFCLD